MSVAGILHRADLVAVEGLVIDYSSLDEFGMITSFVEVNVVVCGFFCICPLTSRTTSCIWKIDIDIGFLWKTSDGRV